MQINAGTMEALNPKEAGCEFEDPVLVPVPLVSQTGLCISCVTLSKSSESF